MIQTKDREKIENLINFILELQDEGWKGDPKYRQEIFAKLVQYAQILGINLPPADPEFLPTLLVKILEEYQKGPEQPPANTIPPDLVETYEKDKQIKEEKIKKALASNELYGDYQDFKNQFKNLIAKAKPNLSPPQIETVAEKVTSKITASLPPIAQAEFLSKTDTEQVLVEAEKIIEAESQKIEKEQEQVLVEAEKIIEAESQKAEVEQVKILGEARKIIENSWTKIQTKTKAPVFTPEIIQKIPQIAATPQIIEATKEKPLVQEAPIDLKKLSLPPEIIKQIESEIIRETYSPLKTLLDPQASFALVRRTFYTPSAKAIQMTVTELQVPLEQKESFERLKRMVFEGVFKEDLVKTRDYLQKILPAKHPAFTYLNREINAFDEIQKMDIKNWLGKIVGRDDRPFVKVLKRYYEYTKKTGKLQVKDKFLNAFLKLSPDVLGANKRGYSFLVRRLVDKFQFLPNLYQKTFQFITRGRYSSFGAWTQKFVYGKILKPVLIRLGKTAAGQAVKTGVKKAATWIATKLGMKLAIEAGIAVAGGVSGPPGWVVAAVTIGLDILRALGRKVFSFIRRIIQEPDKALGSVGVGVLLLIFIPMPFALIGAIPLVIGGIGLASFVLAPATLTTIGGGISAFFTTLTTSPFTLPIALFVIILLSILAGLTLFIVLVVSGAFILPSKVAEVTPTTISPYESPYFELKKTTIEPSIMDNLPSGSSKKITYKFTITAKDKKLTIISINEEVSLVTDGNPSKPQAHSFDEDLKEKGKEINPGEIWEVDYTINIDSSFNNTAIINTINVNLAVDQVAGNFPGITSAIVTIGKPPGDCPLIWPTHSGYVTQGPESCFSHTGQEAIDIGVPVGTPVFATHKGTVTVACDGGGGGNYVKIEGSCGGVAFSSWYLHLKNISVSSGQTVTPGTQLGISGNTVNCRGGTGEPHLHYEFRPFGSVRMVYPNVPKTVTRKCGSGYAVCDPTRPICNTSW